MKGKKMERPYIVFRNGKIIGDRWEIREKIGSGGFGYVYRAIDMHTLDEVALKVSMIKEGESSTKLIREAILYKQIESKCNINPQCKSAFVPKLLTFRRLEKYEILALEMVGPSLHKYIHNSKLSFYKMMELFKRTLDCIQRLHDTGIIHRDIKPQNICEGKTNKEEIYLIDFGLSCRQDEPFREDAYWFVGSIDYASLNAMYSSAPSPKDDLESLCYSMMTLLQGPLPFQSLNENGKRRRGDDFCASLLWKSQAVDEMCATYADVFEKYLKYAKSIKTIEAKDYSNLRDIIDDAMTTFKDS